MTQGRLSEIETDGVGQGGTDNPVAEVSRPAARRSAGLWRAVAGMAISLALACVIVAMEFSSRAVRRANHLNRRVGALVAKVHRMETELVAERAEAASMRNRLASAQAESAVLMAPDLSIVRLSPPAVAGPRSGTRGPSATLALSRKRRRAVLRVEGLRPPGKTKVFVLWLSPAHGAVVKAAEFRTAANGRALVSTALSAKVGAGDIADAMVTTEPVGRRIASPSNAVQLRSVSSR